MKWEIYIHDLLKIYAFTPKNTLKNSVPLHIFRGDIQNFLL